METSMSIRSAARIGCGLLLLCLADVAVAGESMRCGSRLVAEGDSAAKLIGVCGEPALRETWQAPGGYALGALAAVEQWTYNFGSQKLLRVVRLRQGRIERIDSEGYGFAVESARDCSPATAIGAGMSKYRLLSRCGEPLTRTVSHPLLRRPPRVYGGLHDGDAGVYGALEPVFREEWTYNFGSSKLMRIVILDNGVVSDVRTGERGFDR